MEDIFGVKVMEVLVPTDVKKPMESDLDYVKPVVLHTFSVH